MNTTAKWVVGIIIIAALVWLGVSMGDKTPTVDSGEGTIKIGYIGPLSGPSAVLGMDAVPALEIAIKEINDAGGINGRMVELIAEDDQYLSRNTVSAYSKLVNTDKTPIVLVATYGGVFALMDQAKADGVIIIDPLDCNSEIARADKNIFCLATETESIGYSIAEYLLQQGVLNTGVMYSTKDSFMSLVNDAFAEKYEAGGGTITAEAFNFDDTDFRTQLAKLNQSNPKALVLLGHDETGIIMRQARDMGMTAPFFTTGTITSPAAQELSGGASEGTILAYWESDPGNTAAKSFENAFVAKVGRPPILPLTTHPAYDTMRLLLTEVLPAIEGSITADAVSQGLLGTSGYQGVTGTIGFDKDGGARIKESVFRLVGGMPVKI